MMFRFAFFAAAAFAAPPIVSASGECGKKSLQYADYRGTISKTWTGRECQRWDVQAPHRHSRTPSRYPDAGLEENYCRNPDGEPQAWCYTTDGDKRWEYCDIPACVDDPDDDSPPTFTECGTVWAEDGSWVGKTDYRGTISSTSSGRQCQRWASQTPHSHSRTYERYPTAGLEENYCRNPDGEADSWCYTTDENKRWEYCDVPACDAGPPAAPVFCYDYTEAFDLGPKECTETTLLRRIKNLYNAQRKAPGAESCEGGLDRELMALTRTTSIAAAHLALQDLCDDALQDAVDAADVNGWGKLDAEGSIDLGEFFEGTGFLNDETGNFQQEENDFTKRGGYEKFIYIGDDPRLNDYLSTTERSYKGGEAIKAFYPNEATLSFLSSPTANFQEGSCSATNAAVCCWHRDRQYFDNNGNCSERDCANQNPGDNTDLCWTEQGNEVFPYPGDGTENDLHCHGLAWAQEDLAAGDINAKAKWNNLFFVSLYDHLYQRGYVNSITDDPLIAGEQAMCGCVEDMNPVARADCTEAIGRVSYTAVQDGPGGPLTVRPVADSFYIEFRACEGYDYIEDFGPEEYAANPNAADLEESNNDLAAFVYRLYLEGKIDEDRVNAFEQTIIGYRDPSVNDGDEEREAACKAAFEEKYPGMDWAEREITSLEVRN